MNQKTNNIRLQISEDDSAVGYIYLENTEDKEERKVSKMIAISDVIQNYKGVPVYLDFNNDGGLIGIEIVG